MAQSGYTPISLYYSTTATQQPSAGNLVNGELAINITDGKLYYKDNAGSVQLLASKETAAGIANNLAGGSTGAIAYQSSANTTTFLALGTTGYVLTAGASAPQYSALSSLTIGNADAVKNTGAFSTAGTYFIPFLSNNTTSYQALKTSAYFSLNPNTGTMVVGTAAALGGTTNPIIASTGDTNNYIQSYIFNTNAGTSASADFVAYADNSTDAHGWADMGFTSSTYADSTYTVTGPNEAYLFGSAPSGSGATGNLVFATDSTGTANAFQWYVGGFTQAKSAWKMQLTSTGLQLANALAVAYGGLGITTTPSNGYIPIGNGTNYTAAALTAGYNTSITNASGSVTIAQTVSVGSVASGGTITPSATNGQYNVTALAIGTTFAAPSGSPFDGQKLIIRIEDNGSAQTLAWTTTSGGYRVVGTTLPTTTVAGKVTYVGCIYNSQDTFWDVVAVTTQA